MRQEHLLKEHETTYRLDRSFRREVVSYIERCHLEDGGYFFARIPPSSGTDTYFAVKSLSILGVKPQNPEAVVNFFLNWIREGTLGGITGIFNVVEVINELGQITDELRSYAQERIMVCENKAGGFGALENLDVEVTSELQQTYRAVRVLKTLSTRFDQNRIVRFVSGFLNPDGGYGREGRSTLASTFYTTEIHRLLGAETAKISTVDYLRSRETNWQVNFDRGQVSFIEDLFWLVKGLANLGEKSDFPDRVTRFVLGCQRRGGGFSRATIMGIPTLEYTFYALSILREVGVL
jgi:hypothetical protein